MTISRVQKTVLQEGASQAAPLQETALQEVSLKEVSLKEMPSQEAPSQEAPSQETPPHGALLQEIPLKETALQEVSLKKLYIKTYGCQMNVYDSQRMAELLAPLGYQISPQARGSDLVIFNTCHIRAKAEDKLFSDLGRFRLLKKEKEAQGETMVMVVAGCIGQALGKAILQKAPYVDIVVGPQTYHTLPETLAKALRAKAAAAKVSHTVPLKEPKGQGQNFQEKDMPKGQFIKNPATKASATDPSIKEALDSAVFIGFPTISKFDHLPLRTGTSSASAFLTIQEGCDKFCRYCVVPYTRGAEYSRPVHHVLDEASRMMDQGVQEITLLGQNVNAYHGKDASGRVWSLGDLLKALAERKGLQRLRYTTSHPKDMHPALFEAHSLETVMPFLHLPVQSGSNGVLAKMNRQHTIEEYWMILEKLKSFRRDIAFSSDFIVGYPGETEEDFQKTCQLIEKVGFSNSFLFKYSVRPGTPASTYEQIPEVIKEDRLKRAQDVLRLSQIAFHGRFVHQNLTVLVEKKGKKDHQWIGRGPHMQSVCFECPQDLLGKMVRVGIINGFANHLEGVLI